MPQVFVPTDSVRQKAVLFRVTLNSFKRLQQQLRPRRVKHAPNTDNAVSFILIDEFLSNGLQGFLIHDSLFPSNKVDGKTIS